MEKGSKTDKGNKTDKMRELREQQANQRGKVKTSPKPEIKAPPPPPPKRKKGDK